MSNEPEDYDDARGFPNRLLSSQIFKLDQECVIGLMSIETDTLTALISINHAVAQELREQIDRFLQGQSPELDDKEH